MSDVSRILIDGRWIGAKAPDTREMPHGSLPTTEEIFGPVLCLTVARDADEAIAMANDSRFGLGFVPVDKVVGRAFAIVWPPSRAGWIH